MIVDYKAMGKRNRAAGARFEIKVRKDLEKQGWIVARWTNNVKDNKLVPAMSTIFRSNTHGFPDFIAFKPRQGLIAGVECKSNGYLKKEEKAKCNFLLFEGIFHKLIIASKGKKRGSIDYNVYNKI